MEVPGMDKLKKGETHIASASAFVKEVIQDECDDACSICLVAFSYSDPSMVTICQHEFHLQCILEWCQRSSNCPMCWQHISLKDPSRSYSSEFSSSSIDKAGSLDFQSFPDTWRSRLNSMSIKYKESISENTRVWKEKLFSRNSSSMEDIVSEVRTEISAGIATVSCLMERPSDGSILRLLLVCFPCPQIQRAEVVTPGIPV